MSRAVKTLARTMLGGVLALALMGAFSGRSMAASLVTPGIPNQPVYASGACGGYDEGFQRGVPDTDGGTPTTSAAAAATPSTMPLWAADESFW
ncbi:MAG: hypothetical protein HY677_00575 [Chloroflexi bacterium]|nr:hypothetical protein [Chloroflexota bacterium]